MPELTWAFAKNDGGRDSGLHDAGVETFKGNFDRYLAREMIQNSLDARHDQNNPVLVKFELLQLNRDEIPDMDGLKATLARCAEYWSHDNRAKEFFRRAETISKQDKISALRIGDYNTTGVLGSDTERSKNWYSLIRCAGSSSKGGGEGGSFGIGKNAPFAASLLRTVLYSTFNADEEHRKCHSRSQGFASTYPAASPRPAAVDATDACRVLAVYAKTLGRRKTFAR